MGCCCSSFSTANPAISTATTVVITLDGSLMELSVPVTVSEVLGIGHLTCFLCNSDSLSFDSYVPQLHSDDFLQQDQIYFLLPKAKLGYPLKGADMADMAVKASTALMALANSEKNRRTKTRRGHVSIVPVVEDNYVNAMAVKDKTLGRKGSTWRKAVRRSLRRSLSMLVEEVDE